MKRSVFFFLLFATAAGAQQLYSTTTWTSSTSVNTDQRLTMYGWNTMSVNLTQGSTLTNGGTVTFEVSDTASNSVTDNWFSVPCAAPTTNTSTYTFTASTNITLLCNTVGYGRFRTRLSNPIGGTGNVVISIQAGQGFSSPVASMVSSAGNMQDSTTATLLQNNALMVTPAAKYWQSVSPGNSAQATVTYAAPGAGKSWVIDCLQFSIIASQGLTVTGANFSFSIVDNQGSPYTYFIRVMSVNSVVNTATTSPNTGTGEIAAQPMVCGLGIVIHANSAATVAFTAAVANARESLAVGAYIVQ